MQNIDQAKSPVAKLMIQLGWSIRQIITITTKTTKCKISR